MPKGRLPRYGRVTNPPPMRLTERDLKILQAIYAHDELLSFSQIRRMFFTGKSQTETRMMLLYQNNFVNRPNQEQRRQVPEMVYWLDRRGADIVASLQGTPFRSFSWHKRPSLFQVEHHLAVNDFRMDLVDACAMDPNVSLETWVPESDFLSFPDKITYQYKNRSIPRRIQPDGCFMLHLPNRRLNYLLEIDRGTEDNPRFLREKIIPGMAYLKSKAYRERFGTQRGRWLVVTTSDKRLRNMLNQARRGEARGLFYYTTYDQVSPETMLHSPIWRRADRSGEVPLLFID